MSMTCLHCQGPLRFDRKHEHPARDMLGRESLAEVKQWVMGGGGGNYCIILEAYRGSQQ